VESVLFLASLVLKESLACLTVSEKKHNRASKNLDRLPESYSIGYLNSIHPRIKFTHEYSNSLHQTLTFLDI